MSSFLDVGAKGAGGGSDTDDTDEEAGIPAGVDPSFLSGFDTDSESDSSEESGDAASSSSPAAAAAAAASSASVTDGLSGLRSSLASSVLSCTSPGLEDTGRVVFDDALGDSSLCDGLREDIELLFASELLKPSRNRLATSRDASSGRVVAGEVLAKPGVHELDVVYEGAVMSQVALDMCPTLARFTAEWAPALAAKLTEACPALRLVGVDTVKVQLNEGCGGCFPVHYDTSSSHSTRAVTALLYLNPDWMPGDGGELEVMPFPVAPALVEPLNDRLAIFCATQTLHRVCPSNKRRLCVSVWFSSADSSSLLFPSQLPPLAMHRPRQGHHDDSESGSNATATASASVTASEGASADGESASSSGSTPDGDTANTANTANAAKAAKAAKTLVDAKDDAKHLALLTKLLASKEARRLLAKVFYRHEYASSFIDAFGDLPGVQAALSLDRENTDAAARRLGPELIEAMHRAMPFPQTAG